MNLYCDFVNYHDEYYILVLWNYKKESNPCMTFLFKVMYFAAILTMTILIRTLSAFEGSVFIILL